MAANDTVRLTTAPQMRLIDEIALCFPPFAFGLAAAVLLAITTLDPDLARARFTIWVTFLLVAPALMIFSRLAGRRPLPRLWRLLWSFALLAYLAHFWFSFGVIHGGSFASVFSAQGPVVASANFLLTALWILDVAIAWIAPAGEGRVLWLHGATSLFVLVSLFTSSAVFGSGVVRWFGAGLVGLVAVALMARLLDAGQR